MKIDKDTVVIVGAGLSGAVLAERYASIGKNVLIMEKRHHIAGNIFDYEEHGIIRSAYGAHIFHTSHEDVWEYVNRFSEWTPYKHVVVSKVDGQLVPVPVNIDTFNAVLGSNFTTSENLQKWIDAQHPEIEVAKNSEESALKRIGSSIIYELMFKNYTKKQWDMFPAELDASVMERIPVRTNHDNGYFNDTHEAMPTYGYTELVESMLESDLITVCLNMDYEDVKDEIPKECKLFFTGKIDQYFDNKFGTLEYRSLRFEDELIATDSYQSHAVVNYPGYEEDFTRIIEHKKLYGSENKDLTIITKEYSTWEGESYYPVPTQRNRDIYEKYKEVAMNEKNVYFVGRLASYKYWNMDAAIKNVLEIFKQIEGKK